MQNQVEFSYINMESNNEIEPEMIPSMKQLMKRVNGEMVVGYMSDRVKEELTSTSKQYKVFALL